MFEGIKKIFGFNQSSTAEQIKAQTTDNSVFEGAAQKTPSDKDVSVWSQNQPQKTDFTKIVKNSAPQKIVEQDSWSLTMLKSYLATPEGEKNVKSRIKNNADGTKSVVFQNPLDTDEKIEYSSKNKETEKIYEEVSEKLANNFLTQKDELSKKALLHKALGFENSISVFQKNVSGAGNLAQKYDDYRYNEYKDATKIFEIVLDSQVENNKFQLTPLVMATFYDSLENVENKKNSKNLIYDSASLENLNKIMYVPTK